MRNMRAVQGSSPVRIDGIVFRLCAFQLAEVIHDQRGLAFEAGQVAELGFPTEDEDEVDARVLGEFLVRAQAVADHDHVFLVIGLKKRTEYGGVGFAEDMLWAASRSGFKQ